MRCSTLDLFASDIHGKNADIHLPMYQSQAGESCRTDWKVLDCNPLTVVDQLAPCLTQHFLLRLHLEHDNNPRTVLLRPHLKDDDN